MPTFGNFLYTQLVLKIPKPSSTFASKTVIVTGGNSGLGKETVKHLVSLSASKVILACRNTAKGHAAKLAIENSLECNPDIIEVWELDIESASSVKAFVDRVNGLARLDVLISNAGIQTIKFEAVNGTERTIAVNVIGTCLLALQLIPKLRDTAKTHGVTPHLTFVGSALYDVAKYPENHGDDIFAWLGDKSHVNQMDQYNLSKLLLLYIICALSSIIDTQTDSKSLNPNPIVINSLDPCFCKTELAGGLTGGFKAFFKVFEFLFARTAEEGSRLVVIAASAGTETHGKYMRGGAVQEYAPFITNEEGVAKGKYLWELLGKKVEEMQPGILDNLNAA